MNIRRVLTYPVSSWAARGYLALVGGVALYVTADLLTSHPDASFSGIHLLAATGPGSWLALPFAGGPLALPATLAGVTAGAVANATVLSWLSHRLRTTGTVVLAGTHRA